MAAMPVKPPALPLDSGNRHQQDECGPGAPAVISLRGLECDRRRLWVALAFVGLIVAAIAIYHRDLWSMVDLHVYQRGGSDILQRRPLYSETAGLPFTYPPFAALVFVPIAMLGNVGAVTATIAISLVCYAIFCAVCAQRLGLSHQVAALLALAGVAFEPILHTIGIGQVNLVLAAIVVVDCLVVPPRFRGFLLGIAVGVKLTPAIFMGYFLLRRDVRALARCVASFLATVAVAWLVDPHDSNLFWTTLFYRPGHVGRVAYPFNQGAFGDLARLTHTIHPSLVGYAASVAGVLMLATIAATRALRAGQEVAALVCVAMAGLLISPISWTHDWVWLVPASWVLLVRRQWLSAAIVAAVPLVEPLRYAQTPKHLSNLHHAWWQAALCLTYTAAGLWYLLAMLPPATRGSRASRLLSGAHGAAAEPSVGDGASLPGAKEQRLTREAQHKGLASASGVGHHG